MKKLYLVLISVFLIGVACFTGCRDEKNKVIQAEEMVGVSMKEVKNKVEEYIKLLAPLTNRIPEFSNINEADEKWIWWCIRNYDWSKCKNDETIRSVTYEDLTEVKNKLFGNELKKEVPKENFYGFKLMEDNLYYFSYLERPKTRYDYRYVYDIEKIDENKYKVSTVPLVLKIGPLGVDSTDGFEMSIGLYDGERLVHTISYGPCETSVFSVYEDLVAQYVKDNMELFSKNILEIELDEKSDNIYIKSSIYENVVNFNDEVKNTEIVDKYSNISFDADNMCLLMDDGAWDKYEISTGNEHFTRSWYKPSSDGWSIIHVSPDMLDKPNGKLYIKDIREYPVAFANYVAIREIGETEYKKIELPQNELRVEYNNSKCFFNGISGGMADIKIYNVDLNRQGSSVNIVPTKSVVVQVVPETGYVFDKLESEGINSKDISISREGNNIILSFVMPKNNVRIFPQFSKSELSNVQISIPELTLNLGEEWNKYEISYGTDIPGKWYAPVDKNSSEIYINNEPQIKKFNYAFVREKGSENYYAIEIPKNSLTVVPYAEGNVSFSYTNIYSKSQRYIHGDKYLPGEDLEIKVIPNNGYKIENAYIYIDGNRQDDYDIKTMLDDKDGSCTYYFKMPSVHTSLQINLAK